MQRAWPIRAPVTALLDPEPSSPPWFVDAPPVLRQEWKSTEHNTDPAAAWTAVDRIAPDAASRTQAAIAVAFVRSQWDAKEGRFFIGTGNDGRKRAAPLWPRLRRLQTDAGWPFATPQARLKTGLAIGPDSVTDHFLYDHLPHLGATAWAAIAAKGVNPFTGR